MHLSDLVTPDLPTVAQQCVMSSLCIVQLNSYMYRGSCSVPRPVPQAPRCGGARRGARRGSPMRHGVGSPVNEGNKRKAETPPRGPRRRRGPRTRAARRPRHAVRPPRTAAEKMYRSGSVESRASSLRYVFKCIQGTAAQKASAKRHLTVLVEGRIRHITRVARRTSEARSEGRPSSDPLP